MSAIRAGDLEAFKALGTDAVKAFVDANRTIVPLVFALQAQMETIFGPLVPEMSNDKVKEYADLFSGPGSTPYLLVKRDDRWLMELS